MTMIVKAMAAVSALFQTMKMRIATAIHIIAWLLGNELHEALSGARKWLRANRSQTLIYFSSLQVAFKRVS
jgi:hypothetical protein